MSLKKRRWTNLLFLFISQCFVVCGFVYPQTDAADVSDPEGLTSTPSIDWTAGKLYLTLSCELSKGDEAIAPKKRYRAQQYLEDHLSQEFVNLVGALRVDSSADVSLLAQSTPDLWAVLSELDSKMKFEYSKTDEEYKHLEMRWSISLWDVLAPAVLPEINQTDPVPTLIGWYSSRPFSGLVIYAMGPLPWKGTSKEALWEPSLNPRLLNSQGEVIYDRSMVAFDYLKKWGTVAYLEGRFNERQFRDRIGYDPLRVVARGVWGKSPGDLILSDEDWHRLLSQPENRKFLQEGRVLVLWGTPKFIKPVELGPQKSKPESQEPPIQMIPEPPAPENAAKAPQGGEH